jgi:hypothetical protein
MIIYLKIKMKLDNIQKIKIINLLYTLFSMLLITNCEDFKINKNIHENRIHNISRSFTSVYKTFKNLSDIFNKNNITTNRIINNNNFFQFNHESITKICKPLIKTLSPKNRENQYSLFDFNFKSDINGINIDKLITENPYLDTYMPDRNDFKCLYELKKLKYIVDDKIYKDIIIALINYSNSPEKMEFSKN